MVSFVSIIMRGLLDETGTSASFKFYFYDIESLMLRYTHLKSNLHVHVPTPFGKFNISLLFFVSLLFSLSSVSYSLVTVPVFLK